MVRPIFGWILLLLGLAALLPSSARSESELRLPLPNVFGTIPAATYDEAGRRIGEAQLVVEELDDHHVRMLARSGIDGAEQNIVTAELERLDESRFLRLVSQSSRSFDAASQPLGVLSIDHVAALGTCAPPVENGTRTQTLKLPNPDRVANVPLNLLLLPLVQGQEKEIEFQLLLCRGGPRLINATASVARHAQTEDGERHIVEVRYEVDLGFALSAIARPFLPKVAVWFDAESPDAWVAYRMPLFTKGPTVLVVRTGFPVESLKSDE